MASPPSLTTAQPPMAVSLHGRCTLPPHLLPPSCRIQPPPSTPPLSSKLPVPLRSAARRRRPAPIAPRCAVRAALPTVDRAATPAGSGDGELLLEVRGLTAVIAETGQEIIKGVDLAIYEGEVHAIMGKNGSGKSTFAKVLVGHPDYEVTGGSMMFKGENLLEMEPENRSLAGLFMSFQSPVEIPGVSNADFLNMAYNARRRKLNQPELSPIEFWAYVYPKLDLLNMKADFLNRNVNEGFSGGERKRNEILQLAVLGAELAILDEIDSGLDVDALRDVAKAVNGLLTPKNSVLMITHYLRLLEFIEPRYVHVMENGKIVKTGDISIAKTLEKEGFKAISEI
ncbi:ABC transporter I family member 6, chloroplastic [Syzygium oleosum]|uniref:ABC transporter I family member 6, chloroplastic n=1 Tax=Syzygium oleosum TaxID=219896 RepID=UPI0024BA8388|nr:ABC transporter I family member 6, chloroplastic [Syzygium oleosum]